MAEDPHGIYDCTHCFACVEVCPKDVAPMNQIMRLRRRATGDFGTKDSNNGYGHEKAFTDIVERWETGVVQAATVFALVTFRFAPFVFAGVETTPFSDTSPQTTRTVVPFTGTMIGSCPVTVMTNRPDSVLGHLSLPLAPLALCLCRWQDSPSEWLIDHVTLPPPANSASPIEASL